MSTSYSKPIQIRWADVDANRHLRHSAYYDYGALMRMLFLTEHGLGLQQMEAYQMGPILFREEAIFKREIMFDDSITMDVLCTKATADYARWSVRHQIVKADGTLAAIINVDGAWIDMAKRKLALPNPAIFSAFDAMPRSDDFQEIIPKEKS